MLCFILSFFLSHDAFTFLPPTGFWKTAWGIVLGSVAISAIPAIPAVSADV